MVAGWKQLLTVNAWLLAASLVAPPLALGSAPPGRARALTAALAVRVADEAGAALSGATVAISETGDNKVNLLVSSDVSGRVSATVAQGTYSIAVYPPLTGGSATELLRSLVQGIPISTDRTIDVVLRRGVPLQSCVVSDDGRPLPGARVDSYSPVFDLDSTAYTDSTGWFRLVVAADEWLFVTPPPDGGREIGAWLRVADIQRDVDGLAVPVVLDRMAAPIDQPDGITVIHRGAATTGRVRIGVISEGYTDLRESFDDVNRNGRCDDEPFLDLDGDGRFDPNEPYSDANGNGKRDAEPFTDTNGDGVCNRDERAAFLRAITDGVRMLLSFPVYRDMADHLEVVAAFAPSAQAGSDFPTLSRPILRDTLFDSRFSSTNYIFNLDRSKAELEGQRRMGELDVFAVMTNSLFNLGRESASGAVFLFGNPRSDVSTTMAHEFGHSIGKLGDEYFEYDGAPPYNGNEPSFPNLTRSTDRAELKWGRFVRAGTALPTADGEPGVGAFEGAYYRRHGAFRPAHSCLMRRYGPFCPVCSDTLLTKIYQLSRASRPASPAVVKPGAGETLSGWTVVGAVDSDLAPVESVEVLVDGVAAGPAAREVLLGHMIDTSRYVNGIHDVAVSFAYADGTRRVTPAVRAVFSNETRVPPSIGAPRYQGGSLTFPQAAGVTVPGAVAIVNGKDRFPLEVSGAGVLRTVKKSLGSASRLRVSKAIPRRRDVTVRIVNSSGGMSEAVTFRR